VKVETDERMDADYPDKLTVRVDLTQASGDAHSQHIDHPLGHAERPMTDSQVEEKFRSLATTRLGPSQAEDVIGRVWDLEGLPNVRALLAPILVGG
jgi:2-methylcitrate dehydratase